MNRMTKWMPLSIALCACGHDSDTKAPSPHTNPDKIGAVFPADNAWNLDISGYPVHARSAEYLAVMGTDRRLHPDFGTTWEGKPIGIPVTVVGTGQAPVDIIYEAYGSESDPGPFPIPADAAVEGGPESDGDRHVIVVDRNNGVLYELYRAFLIGGAWHADSGARWDLKTNSTRTRGWTSADAAGLPIYPGLVRYEDIERGSLNHAVRFTVSKSTGGFIAPASHHAKTSDEPWAAPMGLRLRLKADFDLAGFGDTARIILAGLKKHGMIVADNGSNWYISGEHDMRWNDEELGELKEVPGSAFEVIDTGPVEN